PDIHLYIDTSGSVSEEDYQMAVKACIRMARKLGVNMYFNSFSHILSQCTKLSLAGKTPQQIYAAFQKVPKVTGGTEYSQVWNYINASKKRSRELSLMITDFEYTAPSYVIKHPENLYYLPHSTVDWSRILREADDFVKSCEHNDPAIRSHLLF
ncbi:MAG: VWA domain-containing protein, partial [Clostridia bacterium]|nr:VWA domain-containing protein [Clostridia bacterium]